MARPSKPEIREFILHNVENHPDTVTSLAVQKFGLSRQGINRYVTRLVSEGLLTAEGNTKARRYRLKPLVDELFCLDRDGRWNEDTIWREKIFPLMKNVRSNVVDICHYGFTEMLNNVLDHSVSPDAVVAYTQNYARIFIGVLDHGVGIFNKIKQDFKLEDTRTALLELSKGKLTSDKKRHSGEGIYFTSRMFDEFSIRSGHLFYSRVRRDLDDWLIETRDKKTDRPGTFVSMEIRTDADWTTGEVFEKYRGDGTYFRTTHVPITLGRYPGEQLVSRSQAKRILTRFTDFSEVILDFTGVPEIGQAFADEIFRIFARDHPEIPIITIGTTEAVKQMIEHVKRATPEAQPDLFS